MIDYIYNDADDRPLIEDEEFIQIFVDTSSINKKTDVNQQDGINLFIGHTLIGIN